MKGENEDYTPKASFVRTITVKKDIYSITCPRCNTTFETEGRNYKIVAIACVNCDCAFNVQWK